MWKYKDKFIKIGRAWTDASGVQHPANWNIWSDEEKISKGLVWVDVEPHPDSRFYLFSQNKDGTYKTTPKALDDVAVVNSNGDPILDNDGVQIVTPGLKSIWIAQTKKTQESILSQTDWAYVRRQDIGTEVPVDVQKHRNEVRLAAETIEGQIAACADLDAFKALFVVPTDANGNPTGNAPIYNWPDSI